MTDKRKRIIKDEPHEYNESTLKNILKNRNGFFRFAVKSLFILFFIPPLYAQETSDITQLPETPEVIKQAQTANNEETAAEETKVSRLSASERRRIEMELKTSTLSELAVWCRTLGLSESGTRDELTRRIRNHFDMTETAAQSAANQKVITIETAQTTDYFTIEVINEDYARLKGEVFISLKDGDSTHKIKANEILFNRTRNILTATGNVTYEKIGADKTETFRGHNITVNIDNWSSIFLDGSSTMESDGTSYLFSGKVISRTDQNVTILRNAEITSAQNDEAYWSLNASKLWLLPGSDFAIFNAVLKVGKIPVLYIPFFYFPTDQLIFHPVIGYRSREGGFIQTTTYILGQPKADAKESSSLSKIIGGSSDMQLEREGLFLRSSGKKVVNPNEISLKAMIDYYTNLGAYLGIDLALPKKKILNPLNLTLGLGFSRTVFNDYGTYTPYDIDGAYQKNKANLFSLSVPFRYRMRINSSISGKVGTLTWDFPYYSDPFIDRDFLNRSESMDYVKMLKEGGAAEEEVTSDTELGIYNWQMSGNINSSFTKFAPYISRISISSISTTLSFRKIDSKPDDGTYIDSQDPSRAFFAPDKFTLYNISGSITGNPLSLGSNTAAKPAAGKTEIKNPLEGIGTPISPWPDSSPPEEKTKPDDSLIPPVLRQTFSLPSLGNNRFNIDYSISPTSSSELQFWNTEWHTYDQVNWGDVQTILSSVGGNANLNFRFNHSSGLYTNTLNFTGTGTWRDYAYINEDAYLNTSGAVDEDRIKQLRQNQYSQTNYQSSYSYSGRIQPFFLNPIFKQTYLNYSFRGTLVRSKRYNKNESPDGPELTPQWGSWVKEETKDGEFIPGLNSHQLSAGLAANVLDNNQNITVTANLPPLDELITSSATFKIWITETGASFRWEKLTASSAASFIDKGKFEGDWVFRPIDLRETIRFPKSIGSLTYNMTLDPEENYEVTKIQTTLSLWELRVNFLANKVRKSEFIPIDEDRPYAGGNWVQNPDLEPELYSRELSLSYNKTFRNIQIIKNWLGINFNFSTSVNYNLQQYTNSNFQFTMGLSMKIAGFLDLSLSATSNNNVIWRYFKNVPGMEELTKMYPEGRQNNIFLDLIDSFSFANREKRESAGFKMQRFSINATHHLGDWTATFTMSMYPYQFDTYDTYGPPKEYRITSDITFLVQWTPITEIKVNVSHDGKHDNGKGKWKVE